MLRAIREIAPRYVVGENVRGLTNWNGGLVFSEVCSNLENLGYSVATYLIPAGGVNAPHRRERIWFIAHSPGKGTGHISSTDKGGKIRRTSGYGSDGNVAHTRIERLERSPETREFTCVQQEPHQQFSRFLRTKWEEFPTQPPVCGGNDGLPTKLDGISFPKWRNESIKAYGNAVCPQVVFEIFKAIEAHENL
jgi:DNA (cytosine-5)-methyltransferase 1